MFSLNNDTLSFEDNVLPDFVESVSKHHYGKKVILNEKVASGHYKVLEFDNGFVAWVSNYIMNDDFSLEFSVNTEEYLAIHFNQIQAGEQFSIVINNNSVAYDDKIVNTLCLTTSTDSFVLNGSKGACINRLKIMVPKAWLQKNVPAFNEYVLQNYRHLTSDRLFFDAMDTTYRSLADKVMNTEDNPFYLSVTQNIVLVITERFFNRLLQRLQKTNPAINLPAK